jgi:hypothetical protein
VGPELSDLQEFKKDFTQFITDEESNLAEDESKNNYTL